MKFEIIGEPDINGIYCAGSFSKLTTTYVCLAKLSESYDLNFILDDDQFLDQLATTKEAKEFLSLFQNLIGSKFTIRDLCSFYTGLPYTFDLSEQELAKVEQGFPFKHHSILDEDTFLYMCKHKITPVYQNRYKFHYSEIAIIFLGYFLEKCFSVTMEELYQKFLIQKFELKNSVFSRRRVENVICKDFSNLYDYPSVAILDHGYFCYSNGFYTTLSDVQLLLPGLLQDRIFSYMIDLNKARAASGRLLNGLTVEIRMTDDDIIYGYEGFSFSGCNIWNYSTKNKHGYLAFTNDEEEAYKLLYDDFGLTRFNPVPKYSEQFYQHFLSSYDFNSIQNKSIPDEFVGEYLRVDINETKLNMIFKLSKHRMLIRNPDLIEYDVIYANNAYRIRNKDQVHGPKIGLYQAKSGAHYFLYDGTLYKKI